MSFNLNVHYFRNENGEEMQGIFSGPGIMTFQTEELSVTGRLVNGQFQTSKGQVLGHTSSGHSAGIQFVDGSLIPGRWIKLDLAREFRDARASVPAVQGPQEVSSSWMKDTAADFLHHLSKCQVRTTGASMDATPPLVATTFEDLFQRMKVQVPDQLRQNLRQCGTWDRAPHLFEKYLITAGLSDRDVLCVAPSSSRRACLLPMVIAMISQLKSSRADLRGRCFPDTLIVCPTKEGAIDCYEVVASFLRNSQFRCAVLHGQSITKQLKELALGVDLLVTTPLCLIPLVAGKIVSLEQVFGFAMVDASDMVDMGMRDFYPSLLGHGMPKRTERLSLMLVSSVVNPAVASLFEEALEQPVTVRVIPAGKTPEFFKVENEEKLERLKSDLLGWLAEGQKKILVWVHSIASAQFLDDKLYPENFHTAVLVQAMEPRQKAQIWSKFCDGDLQVIFTTDAASHRLDISAVDVLLHYELPPTTGMLSHRFLPHRNWQAKHIMYVSLKHENEEVLSELANVLAEDVPEWLANRPKASSNQAMWDAERDQWQSWQWDKNDSWNDAGWQNEPRWQNDQQTQWWNQWNQERNQWPNQNQNQNQNQQWGGHERERRWQ